MCCRILTVAACLLVVTGGPAPAQTGSSERTSRPPSEIGGKTLEQWIAEIKHHDPGVRQNAMRAVPFFGEPAKKAVPALLIILKDTDASCRVHAALSLSALADYVSGDEAQKAVQILSERVDNDPQAIVRLHTVMALGSFGPKAVTAIPSLVHRLHDPNSFELRRAVVNALSSIARNDKFGPDPRAVTAVANLVLQGEEKSGQVRMAAVMALGGMGRPVQEKEFLLVKQALGRGLKDPDKAVVIWATVALMAVDHVTEEGLSSVARFLKGKELLPKVHAAEGLLAMGKEARSRIPDIIDMLDDRDPMAVATAIDVLGRFGSTAHEAVPALQRIMDRKDQTDYFKQAAKSAIDAINGPPKK
jgi:HEAT repeat protein